MDTKTETGLAARVVSDVVEGLQAAQVAAALDRARKLLDPFSRL